LPEFAPKIAKFLTPRPDFGGGGRGWGLVLRPFHKRPNSRFKFVKIGG
jgi:hypothetical protein